MKDLKDMSKAELEEELEKTESDLQELEDERDFSLKQTGLHAYAEEINAQRQAWERDAARYKEIIANLKTELGKR